MYIIHCTHGHTIVLYLRNVSTECPCVYLTIRPSIQRPNKRSDTLWCMLLHIKRERDDSKY